MTTEIERKFVLAAVPDEALLGPGMRLRQGYLAEEGDVQLRVRITDTGAVLTVKAGRGLTRTEVEVAVAIEQAEELWPSTAGRRIEKVRHRVSLGDLMADVDVYRGPLAGLCTAEVEFASEADARAFAPPPWFGRDVTAVAGWDNASLARHGRPG
ncbi:MAG: CYTH domain-containing protein [Acidimicrobiales bacterium]